MKQMTIDGKVLDLEGRKHRNEQTYRETRQKTGEFTPRINQKNTEMIVGICKRNNLFNVEKIEKLTCKDCENSATAVCHTCENMNQFVEREGEAE